MTDEDSSLGEPHEGDDGYDDSVPPLWETIVELGASLPPEEWDRMPTDLAANLHRYLYGSGSVDD